MSKQLIKPGDNPLLREAKKRKSPIIMISKMKQMKVNEAVTKDRRSAVTILRDWLVTDEQDKIRKNFMKYMK